MIRLNHKKKTPNYLKDLKLRIISSQDKKLEEFKQIAKRDYDLSLYKTDIVKFALSDFIDKINTDEDLEQVLIKNRYILFRV